MTRRLRPPAPERLQPAGETLQFMQRLWDLAHALDVRSKRMARELGVTGPQRLVVRLVGQLPDVTASQIAAALGMHPSTLTGVLGRLRRDGLLARAVDAADRRRARFTLTAKGETIDRERKGTVEAAVRRALARAGARQIEETRRLIELLVAELHRDG